MSEVRKKITTVTLLDKFPTETCWEITAKILTGFTVSRGSKTMVPLLGKGEGIFAPVMGFDKFAEIMKKIFCDGGRKFYPWVKETFNINVEDAIEGSKLVNVVGNLLAGPEWEGEFFEKTPERVVYRITRCPWWERYKEFEVDPALRTCESGCKAWVGEGLKAVNAKTTHKITKAMPRGESYCEFVYEFKEE